MNAVYTIENTYDDGDLCVHTSTIFATDDLGIARERFDSYKESCKIKNSKYNNEYVLYQWDGSDYEILDRCDDYDE